MEEGADSGVGVGTDTDTFMGDGKRKVGNGRKTERFGHFYDLKCKISGLRRSNPPSVSYSLRFRTRSGIVMGDPMNRFTLGPRLDPASAHSLNLASCA